MRYHLASDPEDMRSMARAVADYCAKHHLTADIDKQSVARRVVGIFSGGIRTCDQIASELARLDGDH